jgi:predicted HTH transcriptional regulator
LIELIKNNPNITRKEMALVIGKTTKTVQRIISNSSKIVYVGSSKNGHWVIKE